MKTDVVRTARTFLFVPGSRPDRFARALESGADVVVLDLEDAVAPDQKAEARDNVQRFLGTHDAQGTGIAVRINAASTAHAAGDVAALQALGTSVNVMVPKADDAIVLDTLGADLAPGSSLIALIETARGVLEADNLAAVESVARLAFGHLDLCAEIGLDPGDDTALWPMRSALVLASAGRCLPAPVDGITTEFRDLAVVTNDAARARRTGLGAKLCIHPDQVAPVRTAFLPADRDVRWAQEVVRSLDADGLGQIDGQMVDRPVYLRAMAILASTDPTNGSR